VLVAKMDCTKLATVRKLTSARATGRKPSALGSVELKLGRYWHGAAFVCFSYT